MDKKSKIYIAGHNGLVGSAILRSLQDLGYENIIYKTHKELDLLDSVSVQEFMSLEKPEYIFLAAAKVGGILANDKYKADFIYQNLQIQNNIIFNAYKSGVKKLLFLGSSCIYPKECPQPIKEEYLLSGYLEKTNEPYAISKIAGIKMCQSFNDQYKTNFISVMPTNLYGINDKFDLSNSHVIPALIMKIHKAKSDDSNFVEVWGTGNPKREFLFADDLASACVFLMNRYNESEIINIGTGEDISIKDLALLICKVIGYKGEIKFDSSKPDGTQRKVLNVSKIHNLGWKAQTFLEEGLKITYNWYLKNIDKI